MLYRSNKVPGAKVSAGVGVKVEPRALIDTKLNETASINRGFTTLKNMTKPPGGVATEVPDEGLDRGRWRFVPLYTLLYAADLYAQKVDAHVSPALAGASR